MRCYAAGLNRTGNSGRAHGFDAFKNGLVRSNARKLNGTRWWALATDSRNGKGTMYDFDLLPVYYFQTHDVYPTTAAHRLDFRKAGAVDKALPQGLPLDVVAFDAAKSSQVIVNDLKNVARRLRNGTIIIAADLLYTRPLTTTGMLPPPKPPLIPGLYKYSLALFFFGTLVPTGHLRLMGHSRPYAFFAVEKPPSSAELDHALRLWMHADGAACEVATRRARTAFGLRHCTASHAAAAPPCIVGGPCPEMDLPPCPITLPTRRQNHSMKV